MTKEQIIQILERDRCAPGPDSWKVRTVIQLWPNIPEERERLNRFILDVCLFACKVAIMTPEECTTRAEIQVGEHICNHPDRDLQNPYGMIYCENLIRYGNCPEDCRS